MPSAKTLGMIALSLSLISTIIGMLAFKKGEEETEFAVIKQNKMNSDIEERIKKLEQLSSVQQNTS